jgi:hypothetical protein
VLWLFAIVLGIAFGLLTGGRVGNLARLKFRWPLLVIAAVVAREGVLLTPLNRVDGAQYIYVASLAGIVIWTVGNLERLPAMWLITAGAASNLIVISVNAGRMPVAQEFAASLLRHGGHIGQYTVMGSGTILNFLADWIWLYPVPEAYSPGDVLIALGLAIGVFISTATPGRKVS